MPFLCMFWGDFGAGPPCNPHEAAGPLTPSSRAVMFCETATCILPYCRPAIGGHLRGTALEQGTQERQAGFFDPELQSF